MKKTNFTTLGEFVYFNENGDPIASYDLMNWQVESNGLLQLVKVGFYDASLKEDSDLVIDESKIMWHRGNKVCPISSITRSCYIRFLVIQFSFHKILIIHFFCIIIIKLENIILCILKSHNTVLSVTILIAQHQINICNISFL